MLLGLKIKLLQSIVLVSLRGVNIISVIRLSDLEPLRASRRNFNLPYLTHKFDY